MWAATAALTVAAVVAWKLYPWDGQADGGRADPGDAVQVALGAEVYAEHCAACHGERLQGQPNWRERLPSGRLPAPPHDETGHTWHHPDAALFGITKLGPARFAGTNYESDMSGFEEIVSDDEIWAVLAYIKSQWRPAIRNRQAAIDRRSRQ
jgi:mono/diheme cytochrome c family protein